MEGARGWAALLQAIEAAEGKVRSVGEREMTRLAMSFRYRAKAREPLGRLLPEVYALVREAARRTVLGNGSRACGLQGAGKTLTSSAEDFPR